MSETSEFHRFLTNIIENSNIPQKELASRLGRSPSYISKWKNEQVPKISDLKRLSKILALRSEEQKRLISLAEGARSRRDEPKGQDVEAALTDNPDNEREAAEAFGDSIERLLLSINYSPRAIPPRVRDVISYHGERKRPPSLNTDHLWAHFSTLEGGHIRPEDIFPFVDAVRWIQSNESSRLAQYMLFYPGNARLAEKANEILFEAGIEARSLKDLYDSIFDPEQYYRWVVSELTERKIHADLRVLFHPEAGAIETFYQPLEAMDYGYQASEEIVQRGRKPAFELIEDWFNNEEEKVLIITGEPGAGKSTLVERVMLEWLADHRKNPSSRLPILISLERYKKAADFSSFLHKTLSDQGVQVPAGETLKQCDSQGMFIFILDGMDEMIAEIELQRITDSLKEINLWVHERTKLVVTCRTEYHVTALREEWKQRQPRQMEGVHLPLGRRIHLLSLSKEFGIGEVVKRRLDKPNALMGFLRNHPAVEELVTRPLFLEFLIDLYQDEDWRRFIEEDKKTTEMKLLKTFMDRYLKREVIEKTRALMSSEKKLEVAESLALAMRHDRSGRKWSFDDIVGFVRNAYSGLRVDERDIRHFGREFALSMFLTQDVTDEPTGYYFAYSTFQDFLCAHRVFRALNGWPKVSEQRLLEDVQLTKPVVRLSADLLEPQHTELLQQWLEVTRSVRGTYLGANCFELLVVGGKIPEDLAGTDLNIACMRNVDLGNADLRGKDYLATDLAGADLSNAVLSGVKIDTKTYFENVNFEGAMLSEEVRLKIDSDSKHPRLLHKVPKGMAYIPAGEARIASGATIPISAFLMDRYPVTNREFSEFIVTNPNWDKRAAMRSYKDKWEGWQYYLYHWSSNEVPEGLMDHPVVWVPYDAAEAYAQWKGEKISEELDSPVKVRLPMVDEWEWAARGGQSNNVYPWGEEPRPNYANYDISLDHTTSVGAYPSNAFGLYDMAGNVWEWCLDSYGDKNEAKPGTPKRIRKGGGFLSSKDEIRSDYQEGIPEGSTNPDHGFRCVMELPFRAKESEP